MLLVPRAPRHRCHLWEARGTQWQRPVLLLASSKAHLPLHRLHLDKDKCRTPAFTLRGSEGLQLSLCDIEGTAGTPSLPASLGTDMALRESTGTN